MTFTDPLDAVRYAAARANQSGLSQAIVTKDEQLEVVPLVNALEERVIEVVHSVAPII